MTFVLGKRSKQRLEGVHQDLVDVVELAITLTQVDFTVLEGRRSLARQKRLVAQGKSKTLNSRHLTGHAVDVAPWVNGTVNWNWNYFYPIADAFIASSKELDVPLRWGGNWRIRDIRSWEGSGIELAKAYPGSFPDGPHFELPREYYGNQNGT